jgi:pimeloyl-ACP methyl ester carboxylesterase
MWRRSVVVCEKRAVAVSLVEWSRRGFPCVLVHGLGDAACVWNHLANQLMSAFRLIGMELRGHGDSAWDPERRYDNDVLAGDLSKIVALLGLKKIALVGHSLGAAVAIRFAADNPGVVSGLVIVDFGPELDETGVNEVLRGFADAPETFASAEQYAEWLVAHRPLADPSQLRQLAHGTLRQSPSGQWRLKADPALATASQISKLEVSQGRYRYPELWSALERIKCPTLVVRGMGSGILPHDVAARMADGVLSAGRLVTVAGAGHAVMMDNPAEFTRQVTNFLAGNAVSAGNSNGFFVSYDT